jgi:hypothetical protein
MRIFCGVTLPFMFTLEVHMRNEVVMDQRIQFLRPYKKIRSQMMYHLTPETKLIINYFQH